jgi:hypothetical protein
MCSVLVIVGVALSNTILAGSGKEEQISGTVVFYNPHVLTIEDSKKKEHTFRVGWPTGPHYTPKEGDKVTVHWAIGLHNVPWASEVEKIENGSKKD